MNWSTRILISSSLTLVSALMVTACGSNKDDNKGNASAGARGGGGGGGSPSSPDANTKTVVKSVEMKKSESIEVTFLKEKYTLVVSKIDAAAKTEEDKSKSFLASALVDLNIELATGETLKDSLNITVDSLNKKNNYAKGGQINSTSIKDISIGYSFKCKTEKCDEIGLRLVLKRIVNNEKDKREALELKDATIIVNAKGESELTEEKDLTEAAEKRISEIQNSMTDHDEELLNGDSEKPKTIKKGKKNRNEEEQSSE